MRVRAMWAIIQLTSIIRHWVLPININTIKTVLLHESDGGIDESRTRLRMHAHIREHSTTSIPSTDGDERFQ